MSVTKAVIPAAGLGTRMLPAARAVAKELLPVLDRPTIQYVAEEAAAGGIRDILLISSPAKRAVEKHFQPDPELEERLRKGGKAELLTSLRALMAKVRVTAVDQPQQLGLGDAVRYARTFAGGEAFLCMLGDAIFRGETSPAQQLIAAHREFGTSVIGVEQVAPEKVERYGIIGGVEIRPGVWKIDRIVEKPPAASAPSRLAVAARYVLTPAIFDCLDRVTPGAGGEIQLTDAIQLLLAREPVHAVVLTSVRHDIGSPIDWLKTNLAFAARDVKVWKQIAPLARELLDGARRGDGGDENRA
jgi:UTP--glucose-1-phosphate uridylyltransferase